MPYTTEPPESFSKAKVFLFDVFGTTVDWRTTVVKELKQAIPSDNVNHAALAQKWRQGYIRKMAYYGKTLDPAKDRYPELDDIHRELLDEILKEYKIDLPEVTKQHLNLCWHRLLPWADTNPGLAALSKIAVTGTLSNGSVRLLLDLKKVGQLPFDMILSSELFSSYKPSPRIYLGAAKLLNYDPSEICLVAAHGSDLKAAKACGFLTAFIYRPGEGDDNLTTESNVPYVDVIARDFVHLASLVGTKSRL